jgi:hypothetical protein
MVPLVEKFASAGCSAGRRTLLVHIGNTLAYTSKTTQNLFGHNPLKSLPHPPYFFDVSPSDFYLFGNIGSTLIERKVPNEIDALEAVTEILNGISDAELQHIFVVESNVLKE